jgi:Flp pilus assembly protein CpaB
MLAGIALVLLCSAIGAWVFASTSKNLTVLVASRDIAPGEVISSNDLRLVEVGHLGDVRAIQASQESLIVGRAARGPIPAGTVLNAGLFVGRDAVVPAGQVVVGASLDAGAAPTASLAAGDRVDVLGVARTSVGATPADGSGVADLLTSGSVWSVNQAGSGATAKVWVSLLIPVDAQAQVAQAAADGRLRLSLTGVDR